MKQSVVSQSFKQSMKQWSSAAVNEAVNDAVSEAVNQALNQALNQAVNQAVNQALNQTVSTVSQWSDQCSQSITKQESTRVIQEAISRTRSKEPQCLPTDTMMSRHDSPLFESLWLPKLLSLLLWSPGLACILGQQMVGNQEPERCQFRVMFKWENATPAS
jgi:small-conductance mechanosensitive channel